MDDGGRGVGGQWLLGGRGVGHAIVHFLASCHESTSASAGRLKDLVVPVV